jgi:ArsR family transcriptional regulator, lead/cadmium/zinc/bismuth-responsive transcriptional repressor
MTGPRPLLAASSATALAETFKVLGDLTRVRILDAISRSELCVHDIAGVVGLSESAVSHQLRLLRSTRLVRPRRQGRQVFYVLDDRHIVRLFEQGLEHVLERDRVESNPDLRAAIDTPMPPESPQTVSRADPPASVPSLIGGRHAQGRPAHRRRSRIEPTGAAGTRPPSKKKTTSRGA